MTMSPDSLVLWHLGPIHINATLVYTWLVMLLMVLGSWCITRKLKTDTKLTKWQNLLEVVVTTIGDQIRNISRQNPSNYLPFIGTLFLFIAVSNLLAIFPGYLPPTGSLSTTTALAICVLIAVPAYGIAEKGLFSYLKNYIKPTPFMLPFNLIGEASRTIALAVRLYGNIMSGTMIVAILLSVAPILFPVLMQVLGLLTGMIQAYIFAVLAMVYIASGTANHKNFAPQNSVDTSNNKPSPTMEAEPKKGE